MRSLGAINENRHGIVLLATVYDPDPEYYADTCNAIAPHTDGPYRHSPPAITCFHFIHAASEGGASTLTDAFRIGVEINKTDPEAFRLLSNIPVTFHRRLYRRDKDYRVRAPIFSLDEQGEIAGFRLLDRAIGRIDAAEEDVEPYYEALRLLLEKLYDPDNQANLPCPVARSCSSTITASCMAATPLTRKPGD